LTDINLSLMTTFKLRLLLIAVSSLALCSSFTTTLRSPRTFARFPVSLAQAAASGNSLVVISPPGGVGEVAAVKAATMGSSVRWFVVSPTTNQQVVLSQEALDSIAEAGGSVELAGADAESLLLPAEDSKSALKAVSAWCGSADAMVCTFDGVEELAPKKKKGDEVDPQDVWKNAIKVAAKEASGSIRGTKLAILSAMEDVSPDNAESSAGFGGLIGNLFGGGQGNVPATLPEAMAADASSVLMLRHGQLFGMPESSPEFSALAGGPRRQAELCEEYAMRTVRVDPTLSVSGNLMMGSTTRSSRHAVGEAAALMAIQRVPTMPGLDVCVSSQRGTDPVDMDTWKKEFERVGKMISSGEDAQLFYADFSSVPDVERLSDWLAEKWAPAVLRTYDIAAIRVGARPVSSARNGDGKVEIVWQQLVNMETATVGKMLIQVSNTGLVATRAPGDAAKGFGSVSRKPLNGEDVLVRRLAEAVSQAIEKGLAKKVRWFYSTRVILFPAFVVSCTSCLFLHNSPRRQRRSNPSQSNWSQWRLPQ
jgi:hypothetical protein